MESEAIHPIGEPAGVIGFQTIDLGSLATGAGSEALGVDSGGRVVGTSDGRPFIWSNGTMTALAGGTGSASAINSAGLVAGVLTGASERVVVWDNGTTLRVVTPVTGTVTARLVGLNGRNDVVSEVGLAAETRGIIWRRGRTRTNLRYIGAVPETVPRSLNNAGQVVGGGWVHAGGIRHPFFWSRQTIVDIGTLGHPPCPAGLTGDCSSGEAMDINEDSVIVGWSLNDAGLRRAFVWRDGVLADLGVYPGEETAALFVDNSGRVVGTRGSGPGQRTFYWDKKTVRGLGSLGGGGTVATAMNNKGYIVGTSLTATGERHAFVWFSGKMMDLGSPLINSAESAATAVNSKGYVVGWSRDVGTGLRHALLWKTF